MVTNCITTDHRRVYLYTIHTIRKSKLNKTLKLSAKNLFTILARTGGLRRKLNSKLNIQEFFCTAV